MFVSNGAMESLRIPCQGRAESGGNVHSDSGPFPDLTMPLLYVAERPRSASRPAPGPLRLSIRLRGHCHDHTTPSTSAWSAGTSRRLLCPIAIVVDGSPRGIVSR